MTRLAWECRASQGNVRKAQSCGARALLRVVGVEKSS